MARTEPGGNQIKDGSLQRRDMDVTAVGQSMLVKVIQGTGVTITSTGGDAGTGDATIALAYTSTLPSASNPTDVGSAGTATDPARRDHIHQRERVITHVKWSSD